MSGALAQKLAPRLAPQGLSKQPHVAAREEVEEDGGREEGVRECHAGLIILEHIQKEGGGRNLEGRDVRGCGGEQDRGKGGNEGEGGEEREGGTHL